MEAWNCQQNRFNENFKQFGATIMVYLQSDGYQSGYFHKIWVECYCLGENQASETFCWKFIRCQSPCQLQNLIICQYFFDISRVQKPTRAKYFEFKFVSSKKTRLHRYHQNENQHVVTSSSYINLAIKLLIKLD